MGLVVKENTMINAWYDFWTIGYWVALAAPWALLVMVAHGFIAAFLRMEGLR